MYVVLLALFYSVFYWNRTLGEGKMLVIIINYLLCLLLHIANLEKGKFIPKALGKNVISIYVQLFHLSLQSVNCLFAETNTI